MKKLLCRVLLVGMLLSLAACGEEAVTTATRETAPETVAVSTAEPTQPTTAPATTEEEGKSILLPLSKCPKTENGEHRFFTGYSCSNAWNEEKECYYHTVASTCTLCGETMDRRMFPCFYNMKDCKGACEEH